jgi:type VI secretion system protein ImpB
MAKEGSVAPRERVNIVYRPATEGAQEDVELPLKLLVMGDFTQNPDDRAVEDREPVSIDKDNFNEVLKAQNIEVSLNVANRLSGDPSEEMAVNLKLESMKDFSPEAIAQQIPELKRLLELRESLKTLKGPLSNIPGFRNKIQELIKDETAREKLLNELGIDKEA